MAVTDYYWAKDGQVPQPAPFSIRVNGELRTDPSTFTENDMQNAGFNIKVNPPSPSSPWKYLDWDHTNKKWVYRNKDIQTLMYNKIEELRAIRDLEINSGVEYTFTDGTTCVVPTEIPYAATRMGNLTFGEARELVNEGNGNNLIEFEDMNGQDVEQSASEVLNAARKSVQKAQEWQAYFRMHKQNIKKLTTPKKVYEYNPETNGGWPNSNL